MRADARRGDREQLDAHRFGQRRRARSAPTTCRGRAAARRPGTRRPPGRSDAPSSSVRSRATLGPSRLTKRLATLVARISCAAGGRGWLRHGPCASAREGLEQLRLEQLVVGQAQLLGRILQRHLRHRQQDGELGPGQAAAFLAAAKQFVAGRQALDLAVEAPGGFEQFDRADMARAARRRRRLSAIDSASVCRRLSSSTSSATSSVIRASSVLRLASVEPALAHFAVERDLDVHFIVRAIDARPNCR